MIDGVPFGRYRLLKRLGAGGMAEVFLALDGERRVALKRILPKLAAQREYQHRFLAEAQLGTQLSHPFLAQVLEVGQLEGDLYLAMEYVHGVNLSQLLERARDQLPPWSIAVRIAACAAEALQYAHEVEGPDGTPLGLVHRDVSSANVMVGFQGAVKVVDLGVARTSRGPATRPGLVIAKAEYAAPELYEGARADARVDIYGLAITLFELLTGTVPLRKDNLGDTVRAVLGEPLPALKTLRRDAPKALGKLIAAATAKSPGERPTTMRELRQQLEDCLREQPKVIGLPEIAATVRGLFPTESRSKPLHAPPVKHTARLIDDDAPTEHDLSRR
jgi:serine/threonine-protein kinase